MNNKNYKEDIKEIKGYFDAATIVGEALGYPKITPEEHDRFWKWMMVPLMDVPDEELIWCYKQDKQNSFASKNGWLSEINRRGLKIN